MIVLTFDIDWAPDFVIDFVADQMVARGVRATWFVTHQSPAIERLRQCRGLFELGIHPNFLPDSTHGDTPEDVLRHCMALAPEAISMRTHSLVQSSPLLEQVMTQTPIVVDVSLFLPYLPNLQPFEYRINRHSLWRIPYFWEDDFEMEQIEPCWRLTPLLTVGEGLKVFSFHPIHVYLNSANMGSYQALKRRVPELSEATPADADACVNVGEGARTLFMEVVEHLAIAGHSICIRDVYQRQQKRDKAN